MICRPLLSSLMVTSSILISDRAANAGTALSTSRAIDATLIFSGGYQIPLELYQNLESSTYDLVRFVGWRDELESSHSLTDSALLLSQQIESLNRKPGEVSSLLIGGHSRGGAISCLSALSCIETHNNEIKGMILIDPVDDAQKTVLTALELKAKERKSFFPSCLIVLTPFGGRSNYYRTSFTSACSPPERGASSFFQALGKFENCHVNLVTIPSMGHLDVLRPDEASKLSFSGICASNPNKDERVAGRKLIELLVRDWIDQCLRGKRRPVLTIPDVQEFVNLKVTVA